MEMSLLCAIQCQLNWRKQYAYSTTVHNSATLMRSAITNGWCDKGYNNCQTAVWKCCFKPKPHTPSPHMAMAGTLVMGHLHCVDVTTTSSWRHTEHHEVLLQICTSMLHMWVQAEKYAVHACVHVQHIASPCTQLNVTMRKQHILKNEKEDKNVLILLFSSDFSYTCWFLCNLLLYLPLANDIWWVSVIFNFIWPVLTDTGLIFKFLIFSPWKITFCWKNILSDTFSRGYPVWKCELWLDLSNKTQKHNSAGCDHELFI